jgi:DNA-binding CsgD family transcriptional regulator/PAS domain-containing protein
MDGAVTALAAQISEADLAIALIDLSDLTFVSVSQYALDLYGLPASALVGRPATDFVQFADRGAAIEALKALSSGAISVYVAHRELHAPVGAAPMATEWLRSFDLGDRRLALAQAAPAADSDLSPIAKHLGHEPTKMAIGTIRDDSTITAMSQDVTEILGLPPEHFIGRCVFDRVACSDIAAVLAARDRAAGHTIGLTVHLENAGGEWVELCCLLTPLDGNPDRCFILVPPPDATSDRSRISELERHLWQIAGIVEASGVLQEFGPMRDMTALPQVNHLTTRQWEVLTRVVRGERVPTIAADLHVSQSTVRNHLAVIFKRFGVHSQPELLRALESARDGTSA